MSQRRLRCCRCRGCALSSQASESKGGEGSAGAGVDVDDCEASTLKIAVGDCPVEVVTVFNDRAEVTRRVQLEELTPGMYDVIVPKLTQSIVADSIRVKGEGFVTILEVCRACFIVWRVHVA